MKRLYLPLAMLSAWLCVSCAGLTSASAPPFVLSEATVLRYETSRVENVAFVINLWERTYAVPGTTPEEIGSNLDALRRNGTGHGPYSASTKWDLQIGLRYADQPEGCRIDSATVELLALITLPALDGGTRLEAEDAGRWAMYIHQLREHELQHVDNEIAGARRLQADVRSLGYFESCSDAGAAANALVVAQEQAINEADQVLDAETEHGVLTGATFP